MRVISLKSGTGYLAPFLLVIIGVFAAPSLTPKILEYRVILTLLPYVLLIFVTLLALHFNVGRMLVMAVVLLFCYWLLQGTWNRGAASQLVLLLSILLPLNFSIIALCPDRGVRSMLSYALTSLVVLEVALAIGLINSLEHPFWQLYKLRLMDLLHTPAIALSQFTVLTTALAALVILTSWLFTRNSFNLLLLLALVTMALVLNQADVFAQRLINFSILSVVMLTSLLFYSHNMAYRDELTGLRGRRALNEYLSRMGRHYVIAMLDVDRFKKFNDTYGHDMGDHVLRMVGAQLANVSGGGKAFRYGGEEFAIVFNRKQLAQVKPHLEVVREMIADYPMKIRSQSRPKDKKEGRKLRSKDELNKEVCVTVSIGAAERLAPLKLPEQVIKAADQALYQAKRKGRNRVCVN